MAESKTVLLVEDEKFLSNLLKARLESVGVKVIQIFDGSEAIKLLADLKPDLILMDIILPKISGFEIMEMINADPALHKAPIVIISNLGQDGDIQKGKALGAVEYFIKAKVSIDELVKKIMSFLQ
ncbi:MAG: response regulator [Candidatus Brennerbacteria bacterium]|nr:response regulator [Candidatus Brennerbacteria bacterium]